QPTMHELGRPGRRPASQVVHFTEEYGIAPAGGVARDAAAIDAASDDGEVENPVQQTLPPATAFDWAISLSFLIRSQVKTKASERAPEGNNCGRWEWRAGE